MGSRTYSIILAETSHLTCLSAAVLRFAGVLLDVALFTFFIASYLSTNSIFTGQQSILFSAPSFYLFISNLVKLKEESDDILNTILLDEVNDCQNR